LNPSSRLIRPARSTGHNRHACLHPGDDVEITLCWVDSACRDVRGPYMDGPLHRTLGGLSDC